MKNFTLKKNYNKNIKIFIKMFVFFCAFFVSASVSHAVTEVYFQNEAKTVSAKDNFSVILMFSSLEKPINVIDGTILYDKDKLEIKKIKTGDSVFSLWTEEPTFDNTKGELSFVGGIPNGFTGKDGQILKIDFLAKKAGNTLVSFQDVFSVFVNDGLGTQINPWLKPLSLTINEKPMPPLLKNIKNILITPINYLWLFLLVVLFIIIRMFIKHKNKRREK